MRIDGHVFRLAPRAPRLGEDVAALGFPLGLQLTVTRGTASGSGRSVLIDGARRRGLIQTDAAVNPGNSGGPLLSTKTEDVLGLVDLKETDASGISFAVSARLAQPLLDAWRSNPKPAAAADCGGSTDVSQPAATPAPSTPPAFTSYNGSYFSLTYPAAWHVDAADVSKGSYFDTTIRSDQDPDVMRRADVMPGQGGDPMTNARQVEADLSRQPGYREISFARTTFAGYDAVRWEFLVTESGRSLHKTDTFFTTSNGNQYAILTQAPTSSYTAAQVVAADPPAKRRADRLARRPFRRACQPRVDPSGPDRHADTFRQSVSPLEHRVLAVLDPPLNLDGMPPTPLRAGLARLRREVT